MEDDVSFLWKQACVPANFTRWMQECIEEGDSGTESADWDLELISLPLTSVEY